MIVDMRSSGKREALARKHLDKNRATRGVGFASDPGSLGPRGRARSSFRPSRPSRFVSPPIAETARRWLVRLREMRAAAVRRIGEAIAAFAERRGLVGALKDGVREPLTLKTLFGPDYWPSRRMPPAWRLTLGLALAPLAVLLPTLLFALLVYQASESDGSAAWMMTRDAGVEFFTALYAPLALGSAIAGAALWALRLRSRRAYAAAGAILGAISAALVLVVYGALHEVVALYAIVAGALSLLALRWLVRVRKLR